MSEQTPRINAAYLERFINMPVRMIGKVVRLMGDTAVLDCHGNVTVHLNSVRLFSRLPLSSACY